MKSFLLLNVVIGVVFSATLDDEWELWKSKYTKEYEDEAAESVRRLVWQSNWQFVQQHNSEGHSYEVEMNEFADLVSSVHASHAPSAHTAYQPVSGGGGAWAWREIAGVCIRN